MGQRVRDLDHARALLAQHQTSGVSLYRWCMDQGISQGSLYWWKRKVTGLLSRRPHPTLVEVRVAEPLPAQPGRYTVEVSGGRCLHLEGDFVDEDVARLVRILERA